MYSVLLIEQLRYHDTYIVLLIEQLRYHVNSVVARSAIRGY